VQFTANEEYVNLVDRARALLSHSAPRLSLDELHLRALRALVTELERQKYAVTPRPRERSLHTDGTGNSLEVIQEESSEVAVAPGHAHERGDDRERDSARGSAQSPRQRGRYVPAAVRRGVFERDQGRCTYEDVLGRRCAETRRLELHHVIAFARGGESTEENLTLRCRAHNALAAEEDFGKEFVQHARGALEHDPWPK
jgi:5-methylcytosine-specific restriction endonuclease McrA